MLRYLGQRRDALVTEATRCRQQITDRLALAWPAVLGAAAAPLESVTFLACLQPGFRSCSDRLGHESGCSPAGMAGSTRDACVTRPEGGWVSSRPGRSG